MDRFLYFVLHIFLLIVGVTTRAANKYFDSRCSIAASLEHIIKLILKFIYVVSPKWRASELLPLRLSQGSTS